MRNRCGRRAEAYPEPEQLDDVPPLMAAPETAVELLVRNQAVDNQIAVEDACAAASGKFPPGSAEI